MNTKLAPLKWVLAISLVIGVIGYHHLASAESIATMRFDVFTTSWMSAIILLVVALGIWYQNAHLLQKDKYGFELVSERLTSFRGLLFRVMKSPNFWVKHDDIVVLKTKYKDLSFSDLHQESGNNSQADELWNNETNFSTVTADLYLAMETITGKYEDITEIEDEETPDYKEEYLKNMIPALNQIWFYLEEKYAKHTAGLINDQGIWEPYQENIRNLTAHVDPKLKRKEFDRITLAEIAAKFQEEEIPKMLLYLNRRSTIAHKIVRNLIGVATLLIICGVLLPLCSAILGFDITGVKLYSNSLIAGSLVYLFTDILVRAVKATP